MTNIKNYGYFHDIYLHLCCKDIHTKVIRERSNQQFGGVVSHLMIFNLDPIVLSRDSLNTFLVESVEKARLKKVNSPSRQASFLVSHSSGEVQIVVP